MALGASQLVTWTTGAILALIVPRYLGDTNLGRSQIAFSLTELFGLFASLGTAVYLTKEVARAREGAASQVLNGVIMRLPLAAAMGGLAVLAGMAVGYNQATMHLIYLYAANIGISSVTGVLVGALQGTQEMRPVALINAGSRIVLTVLTVIFLELDYGAMGVGLAWVGAGALAMLAYLYAAIRFGCLAGRIDVRIWRMLAFAGLPFFVWQSALLVYGQVDVILLSFLTRDAVVGWYGAAYRIIQIPVFFPMIVATALFPALAKRGDADPSFASMVRNSLHTVLLITIPICVGTIALSDRMIETLGYPSEFRHSVPLIIVLALHVPVVGTDMIIGTALNAMNRQTRWATAAVMAAVLNPTLNLAAIPLTDSAFGNGAIGASVVTVVTELFMMGMGLFFLGRGVLNRESLGSTARIIAACVPMLALVLVMRPLFLPVTVAAGAAVYFASCLVTGAMSRDHIQLLRSHLLARFGAQQASQA
jgi:O-antigen/teichoic acid export membrane protein